MNILITNHHLQDFAGTEVTTFTLAKYLRKNHHHVTIYSKYTLKRITCEFKAIGVSVINDLKLIKNQIFDIAHVQHNICAYEVRYYFPSLPMVMWVHGIVPFLEQPPCIDLHISKYFVNNQGGANHLLELKTPKSKIIIIRNIIDSETFFQTTPINNTINNALIISNKITLDKELFLKNILSKLNIKYQFIGKRFKIIPHSKIPRYINKADIVFTLGLGAMETMFCGRIPIIFDQQLVSGDDGMVTPDNFKAVMENNFSGRTYNKQFTKSELIKEIKKYSSNTGIILQQMAKSYYDADTQVRKIIDIYQDIITNFQPTSLTAENKMILSHIINIIFETNHFTYDNTIHTDTKILAKLEKDTITNITSSKFYKLWQLYTKIKVALHQ